MASDAAAVAPVVMNRRREIVRDCVMG